MSSGTFSEMSARTIDALAVAFTVFASLWLVFAILYMTSVFLFFRMRSRGELRGSMSEPEWGRAYICGSSKYYIPLGWLFRRYIMYQRTGEERQRIAKIRVMSVDERRSAIEELLGIPCEKRGRKQMIVDVDDHAEIDIDVEGGELSNNEAMPAATTTTTDGSFPIPTQPATGSDCLSVGGSTLDDDEDRCPICFGKYSEDEPHLDSQKCSHRFHQECILGWLEIQSHRDCPCCRVELIAEDDIWPVVKRQRRERRRGGRDHNEGRCKDQEDDGIPSIRRGATADEDDDSSVNLDIGEGISSHQVVPEGDSNNVWLVATQMDVEAQVLPHTSNEAIVFQTTNSSAAGLMYPSDEDDGPSSGYHMGQYDDSEQHAVPPGRYATSQTNDSPVFLG